MKKGFSTIFFILLLFFIPASLCFAHFGMIIPSDDIVTKDDNKKINILIQFIHPFEGEYMNMEKPRAFGIFDGRKKTDLLQALEKKKINNFTAWQTTYRIKKPGDLIFYVEPAPYWEPAEETYIIHYTKVIVNALGLEKGWDSEVGLKTEIIPLTRPYGLWAGNVFRGIVKIDGRSVSYAKVEVEYYNKDGRVRAPAPPFITQVVKTDKSGVFSYAMPKAGWWGFAALTTASYKIKCKGKKYPVEIGAVLWVRTREMK